MALSMHLSVSFLFLFSPLASYRWCCFPKSPDDPATVTGEPDSIAKFDGKARSLICSAWRDFPREEAGGEPLLM